MSNMEMKSKKSILKIVNIVKSVAYIITIIIGLILTQVYSINLYDRLVISAYVYLVVSEFVFVPVFYYFSNLLLTNIGIKSEEKEMKKNNLKKILVLQFLGGLILVIIIMTIIDFHNLIHFYLFLLLHLLIFTIFIQNLIIGILSASMN